MSTFTVVPSTLPVMLTLCPRNGVILATDAASIFRILLSSVRNTASDPPLTHSLTQLSKAAGLIHSAAVFAFAESFGARFDAV